MREVLPELLSRWRSGDDVALATVVGTWQSSHRLPGAAHPCSSIQTSLSSGQVFGGCVESDGSASCLGARPPIHPVAVAHSLTECLIAGSTSRDGRCQHTHERMPASWRNGMVEVGLLPINQSPRRKTDPSRRSTNP